MSLERFCRKPLIDVRPDHTALDAAHRMKSGHVGAVFVTDEEGGKPIGVLTDRDIVCRVVGAGLDPSTTAVRQVMSPSPAVAKITDNIDDAVVQMRHAGVRRLPIVNDAGRLVGAVTLDDLVVLLSAELGQAAAAVRANRGP